VVLVLLAAGIATPAAPAAAAGDDPSPSTAEATTPDTEPASADAPDTEPASTEPASTDAAGADPTGADPAGTESTSADAVSAESTSADAVSADAAGSASGASLSSVAADGPSIGLLSISQCPSSNLCLWTATPYAGSMAATNSTAVYNTGIVTARSVRNRANTAARLYSGLNGTGTSRCYAAGASVSSTSVTARSFRILGTTDC
ncbi:MAG: peptidase inhibitor family I36 protein, partial [Brevundimonas sp.]